MIDTTCDRVTILVNTRDRHTELTLLMQSLRTQTYKHWDVVILDESQTPLNQCYFFMCLINRIKQENHYVKIGRNELRLGVTHARNKIIESDHFNNPYVMRVDDDCILESDYIEKMLHVINKGYDIASGVTPSMQSLSLKRDNKHLRTDALPDGYINKKVVNDEGDITEYGDNCGCMWLKEEILPSDEFRSNALMKKEVISKIKYEDNLSPVGFREEGFFSTRALNAGFKIGVHTNAIAWHLQTPTGGCRSGEYANNVQSDNKYFMKWFKERSDKWEKKN